MSISSVELWDVCAAAQCDDDGIVASGTGVVLVELRPQAPRLDTDEGIHARVVIGAAAEDLDSDHVLLYLIAFPGQGAVHDVAEKTGHPVGVHEPFARQNAVELQADVSGGRFHDNEYDVARVEGKGRRDKGKLTRSADHLR